MLSNLAAAGPKGGAVFTHIHKAFAQLAVASLSMPKKSLKDLPMVAEK